MTKAVDLAAASEGVATIAEAYKEPTDRGIRPRSYRGVSSRKNACTYGVAHSGSSISG